MTTTDPGYAAIIALRERMRRLEKLAEAAAQAPPADKPASFSDALATLRRTGSASGSAVDALRRQITERPEPATAPSRDALAEAVRVLTADTRGAGSIEEAFSNMKARQARLDALESSDPGASGRTDPTDPTATPAADRLDRILKGQRQ